jgi:hypothetical protein
MPQRISIRADLKIEELEQRYRQARDPVARSPWQIVWLLAQGQTSEEVAEATGYSLTWIRTVSRRYNAEGEPGIRDRRHANPGGPRLLTREQQAELDQALEGAAPDGDLWTGARWRGGSRSASARVRPAHGRGGCWRKRPACAICTGSTGARSARVRGTAQPTVTTKRPAKRGTQRAGSRHRTRPPRGTGGGLGER